MFINIYHLSTHLGNSLGMTLRARTALGASLLAVALLAWIVAVARMRGMAGAPGADLGTLGWFTGIWVTMMAAMMLPSALPTVLAVSNVRSSADAWVFVLGYLLVWSACGLVAYAVYRGVPHWAAGGTLLAAGVYQLTPLKAACLRHCRSPLHFLVRGRRGPLGALRMGLEHAAYCVGCCAGLMAALFALGVMSLFWMAVAAAAILAEKVLPRGEALARLMSPALVALGIWVLVA